MRQIPCAVVDHADHPDDIGHADIVGEIDLPDDAPLPAWTETACCEGCAVRLGLMEPRPAPEPPAPEPESEEP